MNKQSGFMPNLSMSPAIKGALGGGLLGGAAILAKNRMHQQNVEKGMENFYKNHPQQMQQPIQKMGCAEILKLAEENDKESAEKLAQLSQILDTEFVYKDEFVKWAQEKMEEVDEKLEKVGFGITHLALGAMGYSKGKQMGEKGKSLGKISPFVFEPTLHYGAYTLGKHIGHSNASKSKEKTAVDWSAAGKTVGNTALKGLGIAGAGAASMIGGALISDMYSSARSALTKSHNFNKMVQADPSLAEYPAEKVKAYFTTLHEKGGPEISGDPLMASAFVKQQLDFHGSNILDQVSKVIGMRSTLAKSDSTPKLDFSSLLSRGGGMSPPTKPGFNQEHGPGGYFGG